MTNATLFNALKTPSSFSVATLWHHVVGSVDHSETASDRFMPAVDGDLLGKATVDAVKKPGEQWRVRFAATYWTAKAIEPNAEFSPGDVVQVVGRYGTLLLIRSAG